MDPALTRLHTRRRQTLASRRNEGYTLADDFRIPGAHPGAAVIFEAIAEASHDEMPVLLAEYVRGADENVDS